MRRPTRRRPSTRSPYGQQALWFLHRMAPESAAYNLRVRRALRLGARRRCAAARLPGAGRAPRRRCAPPSASATSEPVQRVHARAEVDFSVRDAALLERRGSGRLLNEEAHRPFDLERGPLLRVASTRGRRASQCCCSSMHHIVADFWSLAVLMHELGVLYAAELKGEPPALAALAAALYGLRAPAGARCCGARRARGSGAYWQEALSGELPALDLPTDRPRPPAADLRRRLRIRSSSTRS